MKAICPECEWEFKIDEPEENEILACPDCSLNLKVRTIDAANDMVVLELTETAADDWGQ